VSDDGVECVGNYVSLHFHWHWSDKGGIVSPVQLSLAGVLLFWCWGRKPMGLFGSLLGVAWLVPGIQAHANQPHQMQQIFVWLPFLFRQDMERNCFFL